MKIFNFIFILEKRELVFNLHSTFPTSKDIDKELPTHHRFDKKPWTTNLSYGSKKNWYFYIVIQ